MPVGTLTLRRFNGEERFRIASAGVTYYKDEDGRYVVSLDGETERPPVRTLPDTDSLRAKPGFEFMLCLPKIPQISLKPGRTFQIPVGYDERSGDYLTRFYYVEHQVVDDTTISILARKDLVYRVRITGSTIDVNHYDGSKPPTEIEIDAEFTLTI